MREETPKARRGAITALAGALSLVCGCYLSHEPPTPCDGGTICGACVLGSCDLVSGEGCSEGEVCLPGLDPRTMERSARCAPSRGRPEGAPCTLSTDCGRGLTCLGGPGEAPSFCVPHCCGDADCPADMTCASLRAGPAYDAGAGAVLAGLCILPTHLCDPVRQTGCEAGTACYPAGPTTCLPPGALEVGAECLGVADCAPGLSCFAEPDAGAFCRRLCNGDGDCAPGERCDVGETGVGRCRV